MGSVMSRASSRARATCSLLMKGPVTTAVYRAVRQGGIAEGTRSGRRCRLSLGGVAMVRLAAVLAVVGSLSTCGPDPAPTSGNGPPLFVSNSPGQQQHALQISGGTVQIAGAGQFAAIVDADLARVWIIDLGRWAISNTVDLPPGSAPGRMAVDGDGYLYIALRTLGEVAKISTPAGEVVSTRAVCGDPRGLTWDPKARVMRIACADGSLVTLPPQ